MYKGILDSFALDDKYTGCKVKSWGGLFLCNRWSQTHTSDYKIGLKNVKIYVMAFLNFKNRFCENYKN